MISDDLDRHRSTQLCSCLIFSERAFLAIQAETAEHLVNETGGVFLGFIEKDSWYIVETLDPGPHAIFTPTYFEYDNDYLTHLANKIARYYERQLRLIGLWHRHPDSMDTFSGTDSTTNVRYASQNPEGAVSCLVNLDPKFRLTAYHVSLPLTYRRVRYCVGNGRFPKSTLSYRADPKFNSGVGERASLSAASDKKEQTLGMLELEMNYLDQLHAEYEMHMPSDNRVLLSFDVNQILPQWTAGSHRLTISFDVDKGNRFYLVAGKIFEYDGSSLIQRLIDHGQLDHLLQVSKQLVL